MTKTELKNMSLEQANAEFLELCELKKLRSLTLMEEAHFDLIQKISWISIEIDFYPNKPSF